jgi:arylsulfatase A-like enzyme
MPNLHPCLARVALLLAGLGALACHHALPHPRGVVLVVLDTLRADRLGCYGYTRRPTSPRLDRLADEAVLFENTISHAPWTVASVASILSGFPDTRAFEDGELRRSLVQDLTAAGIETAAITEGGYFTAVFGFDRGFEEFHEEHYLFGGTIERTFDAALAWLAKARTEPFFLLVHSYAAHMPYTRTTFSAGMAPARFGEHFTEEAHEAVSTGALALTPEELELLEALYDGGVQACDREVGRLLDGLESLGLRDETVVVVTSDHGEELSEGRFPRFAGDHGHALHDELVHVPLIVADPSLGARRVPQQVRSMDILPTVLELLGVPVPPDVEGRSLRPFLAGGSEAHERLARGGSTEEGPDRAFVRLSRHKLVQRFETPEPGSPFDGVPEFELFDLAADPGERRNLADERPDVLRVLRAALEQAGSEPGIDREALQPPPDLAEQLRALGY